MIWLVLALFVILFVLAGCLATLAYLQLMHLDDHRAVLLRALASQIATEERIGA